MLTTVKMLLMPPGILLIMTVIGLVLALIHKRWRERWLILSLVAASLLYLLSTNVIASNLLVAVQSPMPPADADSETPRPRAVVILSAGAHLATPEHPREELNGLTLERLHHGARVARDEGLPVLVTGGRMTQFRKSLAWMMARTLIQDLGFESVLLEGQAQNTFENAVFSAKILRSENIDTIYLATHAWHLPRAREAFARAGLNVVPLPVAPATRAHMKTTDFLPSVASLRNSYFAVHEMVGRLWYRLYYYTKFFV